MTCRAESWTGFGVGVIVTGLLLFVGAVWFYRWMVTGR